MNRILVFFYTWLWTGLVGLAQLTPSGQETNSGFQLRTVLSQHSTYPFEPVPTLVLLSNVSTQVRSYRSTWRFLVFVRAGENGAWRASGGLGPAAAPPLPSTITFEPGAAIGSSEVVDLDYKGEHFFPRPGIYWIKAKFYDLNVESEPQRLEVSEPPASETNAVRYLSEHQLFRYFSEHNAAFFTRSSDERRHASQKELELFKSEWDALNVTGTDPLEELQLFIERFPGSRYAQWAKMAMLFVKNGRAGSDLAALAAVHKEMEHLAPTLPQPMNGTCWHAAAWIAKIRGDTPTAQADLDRALATNPDPVLRFRSRRASKDLKGATYEELLRLEPDGNQ